MTNNDMQWHQRQVLQQPSVTAAQCYSSPVWQQPRVNFRAVPFNRYAQQHESVTRNMELVVTATVSFKLKNHRTYATHRLTAAAIRMCTSSITLLCSGTCATTGHYAATLTHKASIRWTGALFTCYRILHAVVQNMGTPDEDSRWQVRRIRYLSSGFLRSFPFPFAIVILMRGLVLNNDSFALLDIFAVLFVLYVVGKSSVHLITIRI